MKRGSLLSVLLILSILASIAIGAQEISVRLESHIIETWDGEDSGYFNDSGEPISWQVRGSKHSADNKPRTAYAMNEWPFELFSTNPEDPESLGVLGINGAFNRQGYNQIELIPGVGSGDDFVPKPIPLPGRVQTLDFWVWGSNFDYYTELYFIDNNGVAHTLYPYRNEDLREPGSLHFVGWKNMFITMPSYIRNAVNLRPEIAALSLSKIVFTTQPDEIVTNFYIYVDHLKVLVDIQENFFDGFGLTSQDRIEEIWGSEE